MRTVMSPIGALCAAFFFLVAASPNAAAPINPSRDDEVVEVLPAISGNRAEERRARQALASNPRDPALALAAARRYLAQAHELGDPRFAGLALAAIAPWNDDAAMPDDILMMKATLQQYLHEFDASVASLERLLARRTAQRDPQAWLTLATVRRVQGRYDESDTACQAVARAGAALLRAPARPRTRRCAAMSARRARRSASCSRSRACRPRRDRGC